MPAKGRGPDRVASAGRRGSRSPTSRTSCVRRLAPVPGAGCAFARALGVADRGEIGGPAVERALAASVAAHVRSFAMGLVWRERSSTATRTWDGHDTAGTFFASAFQGTGGGFDVWIAPAGCGLEAGLTLRGCKTPEEAMDAADRHTVAYADAAGSGCVYR